jgi:hypothetical protein
MGLPAVTLMDSTNPCGSNDIVVRIAGQSSNSDPKGIGLDSRQPLTPFAEVSPTG